MSSTQMISTETPSSFLIAFAQRNASPVADRHTRQSGGSCVRLLSRSSARLELRFTGRLVVYHVLNDIASGSRCNVPLGQRFQTMKRDVRTHECEQRIGPVRRGLHTNEIFKRVVLAVRTTEPCLLRTIKRRAEMFALLSGAR